jgi:hypothetical protein
VPTFIELLEEIADARPVTSISAPELDRLVARFGDQARRMGRWNISTDGSLDIPIAVIREAAMDLGSRALRDALKEIKSESFTQLLESSAAVLLIDRICQAYERHLRAIMTRYQSTTGLAESAQLRDQLVREVFGE